MALIPTVSLAAAGLVSTPAALGIAANAGGDTIVSPDQGTIAVVFNGSGSAITATLTDPGTTPAGNTGTAPARSVAAGSLGFFPVGPVNADVNGIATLTTSSQASVRVAAIRR